MIADLNPDRARAALAHVGWSASDVNTVRFTDDGRALCDDPDVEVVIDATGHPPAGIAHARAAIAAGKHIVMVNVEADVLAGPLLAEEAREAGVVYTMAYGDQPALTAELVDWARACGFEVIAAGKGTLGTCPAFTNRRPRRSGTNIGMDPDLAGARRVKSADVQQLRRRHQIRDRDGCDRKCLWAERTGRWPFLSALRCR